MASGGDGAAKKGLRSILALIDIVRMLFFEVVAGACSGLQFSNIHKRVIEWDISRSGFIFPDICLQARY